MNKIAVAGTSFILLLFAVVFVTAESDNVRDNELITRKSVRAVENTAPQNSRVYAITYAGHRSEQLLHAGSFADDISSAGTIVAILDTGIDVDHEDLSGKVTSSVNFSSSDTIADLYGHGTHVAGIIGACCDNGVGIEGIDPGCKILNVKVAEDDGTVWSHPVAKGIYWATDKGADIINISACIKGYSEELQKAVNHAWQNGVLIVAAASEDVMSEKTMPACLSNVIGVACLETAGLNTSGQIGQSGADAFVPGQHIYSTLPENKYGFSSGNSMATAHISGIASLYYHYYSDTGDNRGRNEEVAQRLKDRFGSIWIKN